MAFNVNEFRGALVGGGARPSLFEVQITNPINGAADAQIAFMCRASSIPALTIGSIPMPYFGRTINVAGNRTYDPWAVTIINDENFAIRNAMEQWNNSMNAFQQNVVTAGGSNPSLYKSVAQVKQYNKVGDIIREYTFNGIFPTSVDAIDLNWEGEAVEEFGVTFAVDYWEVSGGSTGDAGGI